MIKELVAVAKGLETTLESLIFFAGTTSLQYVLHVTISVILLKV
jgi:hypothetical protein